MSKLRWICFAILGALLLLLAARYRVLQYRIAKSAAFCDAVGALPRPELDLVASRCERLSRERGGPQAELEFIRDTNILGKFLLAGRMPYEIVLEKDSVCLKYIQGNWRYSTLAIWEHDRGPSGQPLTALKITYGTYGWRVLSERSEPGGSVNRSQPVGSETNQISSAAGSGG
jgi:hypothetical protein